MKKKSLRNLKLVALVFSILLVYLSICANKLVLSQSEVLVKKSLTSCAYAAVGKVSGLFNYSDIFLVDKNSAGEIQMISIDGIKVNLLAQALVNEVVNSYNQIATLGVEMPLGAISGISFLSGYGKNVNFKVLTVNNVTCQFVSRFEQAGINQSHQSLTIKITPDCQLTFGLKKRKISTEIEFLCYENYIIGTVPDTFVDIKTFSATAG